MVSDTHELLLQLSKGEVLVNVEQRCWEAISPNGNLHRNRFQTHPSFPHSLKTRRRMRGVAQAGRGRSWGELGAASLWAGTGSHIARHLGFIPSLFPSSVNSARLLASQNLQIMDKMGKQFLQCHYWTVTHVPGIDWLLLVPGREERQPIHTRHPLSVRGVTKSCLARSRPGQKGNIARSL